MKKAIVIACTSMLLVSVFFNDPCLTVKANEPAATSVVTTEELPTLLTDNELGKLYTYQEETRVKDPNIIEISQEDAIILMKVAVLEDYTDATSQAYVMSIILNRVNSPDFPNTVKEVVEQKGQFLKLSDKRYLNAKPDVNSHLALAMIESKEIQTEFLFYEALWVKNSWASRHRKDKGDPVEYGGSRFYK